MTSQERNKFRARRSKRVCGGVIEWKSTHLGTWLCSRISIQSRVRFWKEKAAQAAKIHSSHYSRKRSYFGTEYCETPWSKTDAQGRFICTCADNLFDVRRQFICTCADDLFVRVQTIYLTCADDEFDVPDKWLQLYAHLSAHLFVWQCICTCVMMRLSIRCSSLL